ncbi:MAG: hypothetical protein ACI8ZO_000450 [Flavobacteriales bacterium]
MIEPRVLIQEDWILAVFLLILVLFTIVKLNEPKRLQMLYRMFSVRGPQTDFFAFDSNLLNWFNVILSGVFFMAFGLLIYRLIEMYSVEIPFDLNEVSLFGLIVLGLMLYSLARKFIGHAIGLVVESHAKVKRYFLLKQLYSQWIGLFLIPFLLLEFYSPISGVNFTYALLLVYAFLQILSYARITYVFVFEGDSPSYHLFAYICALEILPLLVLVKIALNLL